MKFELDKTGGNLIRGCAGGEILIGNQVIRAPVIVTIDQLISDWSPPAVSEISVADFQRVLDLEPELILLGTGRRQLFPAPRITTEILRLGVGIEVMDTVAACRTFNILASEGRHVAAALFIE